MQLRTRTGFLAFFIFLASAGSIAWSADEFSIRGFGTLGVARSSSGEAEFIRDLSQTQGIKGGRWSGRIDSILGVQANWNPAPEWEVAAQVVSRLRYDKSRDPEVMMALVGWEPSSDLNLRLGRLPAEFMMRADSRLIGYAMTTVRPSVDFFGTLFFSHLDGVDVLVSKPWGDGLLRGKLFAGQTQEKSAGTPGVWDTNGSPVNGWMVDYTIGNWQIRANGARIRYASQIKSFGLYELFGLDEMVTKGKAADYLSLGAIYEKGPLQLQGMLNRIRQESKVFQDSQAGYFLASYRVGQWTPYAGVSRWYTNEEPYASNNANYLAFMRASHAEQTTWTLGTRWDAWSNVAFKLQYDAVRGKPGSKFPYATSTAAWNGRTDVVSMTMDFVF